MNWPIGWTDLEQINHEKFEFWEKSSAAAIQGDTVRAVWFSSDPATPSCGQESAQQSAREHQDSLSGLSQEQSPDGRDTGADLCCKTLGEISRMSSGIKFRADRLKAIGNGQVPIVAAIAFLRLYNDIFVDFEKPLL